MHILAKGVSTYSIELNDHTIGSLHMILIGNKERLSTLKGRRKKAKKDSKQRMPLVDGMLNLGQNVLNRKVNR